MTIVEMRVHMDCPGCETKIKKALQKLDGIDDVDIDMYRQKVTVTGYVKQENVLKIVRKGGRHAELWPFPHNPEYNDFYYYYYNQNQYPTNSPPSDYMSQPPSSYNYHVHGYNGHDYGYYHPPPHSILISEDASSMFNDDNTSACVIM